MAGRIAYFTNQNDSSLDTDQLERAIKAGSFALVGLMAVIGNFLVIFMVMLSQKLHTITNIFVVNLSLADLLIGLLFPLQSLWILQLDYFLAHSWLCKLVGSLILITVGCSVSTMALVAFNRFILITKSRAAYQKVFTPCSIFMMIGSTWMNLTGFIIVPQLVGYGQMGYDENLELCAWDPNHELDRIYKVAILALLTLPLIFSSGCYIKIFNHVRRHAKIIASQRRLSTPVQSSNQRRMDITITKNLLLIICTFYICIMPFVLAFCATGFVDNPKTYGHIAAYLGVLLCLNSCLNPVFVCLKHPHFREVFVFVMRCQMSKVPQPTRLLRKALPKPNEQRTLTDLSSPNTARTET